LLAVGGGDQPLNVTVSGLVGPLTYSPGAGVTLEPGSYAPSLTEWGVVVGVVGFALLAFTLGAWLLPLFKSQSSTSSS
jgi:Ni/Fe-hydrogenase subunit HybB-like protein